MNRTKQLLIDQENGLKRTTTKVMAAFINTSPQETVPEKLMRLHLEEKKSLREIGRIFHVRDTTVKSYMLAFSIPIRPYPRHPGKLKMPLTKEEIKRRQREGMLHAWNDPERRKKWIATLWSQEVREKRSASWRNTFNGNPNLYESVKAADIEKMRRHIADTLGKNPKDTLEDLYLRKTLQNVARYLHISPSTVSKWLVVLNIPKRKSMKRSGVVNLKSQRLIMRSIKSGSFEKLPENYKTILTLRYCSENPPLSLAEVARRKGGITREGVRVLEKYALIRLEKRYSNT